MVYSSVAKTDAPIELFRGGDRLLALFRNIFPPFLKTLEVRTLKTEYLQPIVEALSMEGFYFPLDELTAKELKYLLFECYTILRDGDIITLKKFSTWKAYHFKEGLNTKDQLVEAVHRVSGQLGVWICIEGSLITPKDGTFFSVPFANLQFSRIEALCKKRHLLERSLIPTKPSSFPVWLYATTGFSSFPFMLHDNKYEAYKEAFFRIFSTDETVRLIFAFERKIEEMSLFKYDLSYF